MNTQNLIRPDLITLLDILADYQQAEIQQLNRQYQQGDDEHSYPRHKVAMALTSVETDLALTFAMRNYVVNSETWDDASVPLVDISTLTIDRSTADENSKGTETDIPLF